MTRDTRELDFAHHRQLFLTEQGYSYSIADEADSATLGIHTEESERQSPLPRPKTSGTKQRVARQCLPLGIGQSDYADH